MSNKFQLCAFADEADGKLSGQIDAMVANAIPYLEVRGVDGKNVGDLNAEEATSLRDRLAEKGLSVWSLGSPSGKTQITADFTPELERFKRLLQTADITGAKCIRLFSFFGTDGKDEYFDEVCARLQQFIDLAKGHDVVLCHENEKGIYGDTAERCVRILKALPDLKAVYDPANFLQCGEDTIAAWEAIEPYLYYMHIKDCAKDGMVVPPGEGVGRLPELLARYAKLGGGVLTLEPHLTEFVGLKALENEDAKSLVGGYKFANGREAFDFATNALKGILATID